MVSDIEFKKIYWHSRRGMLELDLILVPFVDNCFQHLSSDDQQRYIRLLECEDTELFSWFLRHGRPTDPDLCAIVDKVLEYARRSDAGA